MKPKKLVVTLIVLVSLGSLIYFGLISPSPNHLVSTRSTLRPPVLPLVLSLPRPAITTNSYTTGQGNYLLVLVNKKIRLPENFVPTNLVSLADYVPVLNKSMKLQKEALESLRKMFAVASKEGVELEVVSAYRSFKEQEATFSSWVSSAGLVDAETFSARAGHSQHQLGTTVDLANSYGPEFSKNFGQTKEGVWLAENSYKFGYILSYPSGKEAITGYIYEPWHFRYVGQATAAKIVKMGVTLEEYLQKFGTW